MDALRFEYWVQVVKLTVRDWLAEFKNQETYVIDPEHDGTLVFIAHIRAKITSNDHMPTSSKLFV